LDEEVGLEEAETVLDVEVEAGLEAEVEAGACDSRLTTYASYSSRRLVN
jgi:hypothetical protein